MIRLSAFFSRYSLQIPAAWKKACDVLLHESLHHSRCCLQMIFRTLNFKRRMVFTACEHRYSHGFVMDGNICTDSWLTSASMYITLWSGNDLEGRTLPQWLCWLHRGWLTLIMWHASRSVLLGQAWTLTAGSRYVAVELPRNHMHELSSGRYNANWVSWTCWMETAAKRFLLCACGT
jgi:hypothetical protein